MQAVVGIASYRWLIWCLEWLRAILAEIHIEVCQILDNHNIVLRSHTTDNLQLLLVETHPRWVVRVRVDHTADTTRRQYLLKFCLESLAAIVDNVERLVANALHATLCLLHREAWVDEEDSIAILTHLREGHKRCKSTLHRTYRRHEASRWNVDVDEGLNEARCLLCEGLDTGDERILRTYTREQRLVLGLDTDLLCWQARLANLHTDILHAHLSLDILNDANKLTNRGCAQLLGVAQTVGDADVIDRLFI